jgi:hypothetical protein
MQAETSRTNSGGAETEQLPIYQLCAEGVRDKSSIRATSGSCQPPQSGAAFETTEASGASDYVEAARQLAYSFLRLNTAVLERLAELTFLHIGNSDSVLQYCNTCADSPFAQARPPRAGRGPIPGIIGACMSFHGRIAAASPTD